MILLFVFKTRVSAGYDNMIISMNLLLTFRFMIVIGELYVTYIKRVRL